MERENFQQHVTILSWVHIAFGVLHTLIGAGILFFFFGLGAVSGEVEAMAVLGFIGMLGAAFMVLCGVPGIVAGYGMLQRRNWGRVLGIIISALNLFNFPIGTGLGIYGLWVLTSEPSHAYFHGGGSGVAPPAAPTLTAPPASDTPATV